MAELTTLARPYAKAAFDYARAQDQLSLWHQALKQLALISEEPKVRHILVSPASAPAAKVETLCQLSDKDLATPVQNFMHVLAHHHRLTLLPSIYEGFDALKTEYEKVEDVSVTSAYPLTSEQKDKLASRLREKLNHEVRLHVHEDRKLIGGVLIRVGDMVIDGSVRAKLAKLSEAIQF